MQPDLHFWHKARLFRISIALCFAITLALLGGFFIDNDASSLLKRGDFPGFYVLAVIHKLGLLDRLYDPALQSQIENQYWPSFNGGFYMSVYPMYTAILLSPLALLSPQNAQYIFTAFMGLCFALSLKILLSLNKSFQYNLYANSVIFFFFAPVFVGILGAQNTALSMLLFISICFFIKKNSFISDISAGIACGLWFYKPQYAVFMLILMLVARLWVSIFTAGLTGISLYLLAAVNNTFLWPLTWIKALQQFSGQNFISNAQQMTSIKGTAIALQNLLTFSEGTDAVASMLSTALIAGIFIFFLLKIHRTQRQDLHKMLLLFGPILVLISPQTLFYDIGIAFVGLLALLPLTKDQGYWELTALCATSWLTLLIREQLPVPIFIILPLFMLYKMQQLLNESNQVTND